MQEKKLLIKQYVVDAFTDKVFKGNPAAVCLLTERISDKLMQEIAKENNLSETAFVRKFGDGYELRWFTPGGEIDLCGHATLASAYVLFDFVEKEKDKIVFDTKSGQLEVTKKDSLFEMDLPTYEMRSVPVTDEMAVAIGVRPLEAWLGRDLVCVLADEEDVRGMKADGEKIQKLDGLLLHVTAKGSTYDCVTRSFGPKMQVLEDPVCGSGHCHVIPIWSNKLGKTDLLAYQASERSGILHCRLQPGRLSLGGQAILYAKGEIYVEDEQ